MENFPHDVQLSTSSDVQLTWKKAGNVRLLSELLKINLHVMKIFANWDCFYHIKETGLLVLLKQSTTLQRVKSAVSQLIYMSYKMKPCPKN